MNENIVSRKDLAQDLVDSGYFSNVAVYANYSDLNTDYVLHPGSDHHAPRICTDGSVHTSPVSYFRPSPHYSVSGASYVVTCEWDEGGYNIEAHILSDSSEAKFKLVKELGKVLDTISHYQAILDNISIKTVL